MDQPSPMICVVTPWRISPCDLPSTSSDSVDQDSMLMKPGATARPRASTTVSAFSAGRVADELDPVAADRDVRHAARCARAVVHGAAADDGERAIGREARAGGGQRGQKAGEQASVHQSLVPFVS